MTDERSHKFSEGQGFDNPYDEFDLDPPELEVNPDEVDPVDSRVVTDILDQQAIPRDRISVADLMEVGLSYMQINRFEQATDTFERAARFADEDSLDAQEAWANKGVAHAELEEWDEAIGAYREALYIDDDSEHAATAETNLAYALWESGRTEQALEHSERAVEIDQRFPQAWFNRGFFLLERGLGRGLGELLRQRDSTRVPERTGHRGEGSCAGRVGRRRGSRETRGGSRRDAT